MKNCDELRQELALTFEKLKAGEIKPGAWNTEEIILAPAKPDQVDYVTIKPSAPRVVLRTSPERK